MRSELKRLFRQVDQQNKSKTRPAELEILSEIQSLRRDKKTMVLRKRQLEFKGK